MRIPLPRTSGAARGLFLSIVLGSGYGCALLPQFGEPPAATPTAVVADSTRVRVPDPDLWPTATETVTAPDTTALRPAAKPKPRTQTVPPPTDAPSIPVETTATDSIEVNLAPAVTVSPPNARLEEIETETLTSLREAKRLIGSVDVVKLDAAGRDKLRIVRGFITQAEEALAKKDLQAAAGFARKARLLAVELASR